MLQQNKFQGSLFINKISSTGWSKFFRGGGGSKFCSKISSVRSIFINKLVPGGTNLGGPFIP